MDNFGTTEWHADASFAANHDMRSHTGATLFIGKGAVESVSSKQKINTRSSTSVEMAVVDDVVSKITWTKLFLEEQGHKIKKNVVYD